jgi:alpha-tubulin suppressor-like RCC1 family protein
VLTVSVNGVPCSKNGSITISGGGASGAPWAWGYNSSGQLGDGTTTERLSPVSISSVSIVGAFEAGESFSLALKTDGTVAAWGYNFFGQLGNGTWNDSSLPVPVSSLTGVTAIAAGRNFALALKSDGSVWAWGHNSWGQLGNSGSNSNVPVVVAGLTGVTAIACGEEHSIAVKSDGTVWTWGSNYYGQLGNGTSGSGSNPTPQRVLVVPHVLEVKGGNSFCLALADDGTPWSWGYNYNGQLGDGTTIQRNLPVQVSGISSITAIAAGYAGSLARKSDGTVWAWGWNGASTESHVPVQVTSLAGATHVAAGYLFAMVLESDGTVWTWGRNTHGQLGDGTLTWHDSPVQVTGLGYALSIAAGDYHALAMTGTAPCLLTCAATVPATGYTGSAVSYAASSTLTGCTGTPAYAWTFGDGATSALQNPTHTYFAAGSFDWTLDVSAAGQACSKSGTIVVSTPQPLTVTASADKTSGTVPLAVQFTGTASGGIAPYTYLWIFADGSTNSTSQSPSHTFTSAGTLEVAFTARDAAGATATVRVTITVTNPVAPPVVTLIKKVSPPFKLAVTGSNLQSGIKVYIDGTQWTSVLWKKTTKILLAGAIKTAVPKGTTKTFRFVNPDGGETTMTWGW